MFQQEGTPSEKIFKLIAEKGPMKLPEITEALSLENRDTGTAFGQMSKEGVMALDAEKRAYLTGDVFSPSMKLVRALLDRGAAEGVIEESSLSAEEIGAMSGISRKRGGGTSPFRIAERKTYSTGSRNREKRCAGYSRKRVSQEMRQAALLRRCLPTEAGKTNHSGNTVLTHPLESPSRKAQPVCPVSRRGQGQACLSRF